MPMGARPAESRGALASSCSQSLLGAGVAPRMATARRIRLLFSRYSPWVDTGGSPPRPKSPLTQARAEDREEASKSTKPRTTAARV